MNRLLYVFLLTVLISCDGNYRDVVIKGQLRDSLTGNFIAGSKIKVTFWVYDTEIWESRKVIKDTVSDKNGKFSIFFEKGEAFDMEVTHVNYHPIKYSKTLDRRVNGIELIEKNRTFTLIIARFIVSFARRVQWC